MSSPLSRVSWYKDRLAAMSGVEIFYRLNEFGKRKIDATRGQRLIAKARDYGPLPEIPGLRTALNSALVCPEMIAQWEEDARRAKCGTYLLLNTEWPDCARDDVWHLDPISGQSWPHKPYCFAINYRHARNKGDVKLTWELNRLQFLQSVAALAFIRKNADLARYCAEMIESWVECNPPFRGVNWSSGIELTLRLISLLTVTTLIGDALSRGARSKIWATIETHARWLARYPSYHSSANNHRAAEALGLFIVGALCPHFSEAEMWRTQGWDVLCEAARLQILPDGAGAEQTIAYTAFLLEMLMTGLVIARTTSLTIPAYYTHKIIAGGEFLRWLIDSKGHHPDIGDDDNACIFGTYHRGDNYVTSIAGCIAALFDRADIAPPAQQAHLRQMVFGQSPAPDFEPQGLRTFDHSGLAVGRCHSANGDVLIAFDYGYLGYLSIAAHGHADALSLWLHLDGQPVLIDAGTYAYHADGAMRSSFRSTKAHNTLNLNGQDSSRMAGNFNWSHKARCVLRDITTRGDFWQIEAEHDGYKEDFGVTHRRNLSVSPASGAVIQDCLIGSGAHHTEIVFLIHPSLRARTEGDEIIILKGEKQLVRLRHESGLRPHIGLPESNDGGWYSPSFGVKLATTRICFSGTLSAGEMAVTRLYWAH